MATAAAERASLGTAMRCIRCLRGETALVLLGVKSFCVPQ